GAAHAGGAPARGDLVQRAEAEAGGRAGQLLRAGRGLDHQLADRGARGAGRAARDAEADVRAADGGGAGEGGGGGEEAGGAGGGGGAGAADADPALVLRAVVAGGAALQSVDGAGGGAG